MRSRVLLIISLLLMVSSTIRAQIPVEVSGYVTSLETGFAVTDKEVSILPSSGQTSLTAFTNNNGYYSILLDMLSIDSSATITVLLTDCLQENVTQTFPVYNATQIQADFQICTSFQGCQAAFTFQNQPANSLYITFSNLSFPVSYSTRWLWDFGDGETSADFEPVHLYAQPGIYNVCLTMLDSMAGCASIFCLDVWAGGNQGDCQAMFAWLPQELTVSFSDLSTGNPNSWFWDFGDGTSSVEQNPVHSWSTPGTFQVCLTIFNDSTQCQDTHCDYITIGDTLPTCHADFSYEQTEGLTYTFTNLSTGPFTEVIWDFGDGSPFSHDFHAVHTWQQPGTYPVCITIYSNYTGCSDVFCIDINVGDTLPACQAAYMALADSIPGNINHYWFIDESTGANINSWFWDFGDGAFSFVQHPEHTFAESGTYNVCLTITGQGNSGYCSHTICQTISTPAYSNLGGQIFAGNFPINNPDFMNDTAKVTLYRKTGDRLTEVTSGLFSEYGYYFFLDVMEGNYVTHAELVEGSPSYLSYIPAYSGSTYSWQSAQPVTLQGSDVFDTHIFMQDMTSMPESGPGIISGNLVCLDNSPFDMAGNIVFLFHDDLIVNYVHTDDEGNFGFTGLPIDAYSIKAEIAGKFSNTILINLTDFQSQATGLQLEVSSSEVYGFEDLPVKRKAEISLFPNPVNDKINIRINAEITGDCTFMIISANGAVVEKFTVNLGTGVNMITTNAGNLASGLYLINCSDENNRWFRSARFIKK